MAVEDRPYQAYLLRLWQVEHDGQPVWRASLEDPHTGQRYGFASLELLFMFLCEQVGSTTPDDPDLQRNADHR